MSINAGRGRMPQPLKPLNPSLSAQHHFGEQLRHWRQRRGLSQAARARLTHVSPDLIGKIEKADRWPTAQLAARWDELLNTDGALTDLWPGVERQRRRSTRVDPHVDPELVAHWSRMLTVLATTD